jgi:hypothetical protein
MSSVTRAHASILVRVLGGFLALLLLWSPNVGAQGATADPERIAAAKQMMDVVGVSKQLDGMIKVMGESFRKGVGDFAGTGAAERAGKQFDRYMTQLLSYREAMLEDVAVVYAQKFTSDELQAVTAFYRSPAGQKFIQAMPELIQASGEIGNKYAAKAMQELSGGTP